jgi:hypothetical protein
MSNTPNYRLPVKREVHPPAPIWQQAAPVVIRGAALVAAGIIGEWALRSAARRAVSLPFSGRREKSRALTKASATPQIVTYTETIVVQRSVTHR